MRIDGDQRLRPEAPARVDRVDLVSDIRRADLGERARKARVVLNECAIQVKNIHDDYCSSASRVRPRPGPVIVTGRVLPLQVLFPLSARTGCKMVARLLVEFSEGRVTHRSSACHGRVRPIYPPGWF